MRLHELTIEAFGPFGGVAEIDFDELNRAGQFLISGATGAGKTSILDAVCFALYGEVPGERQRAKHLRSDHAGPGVEPRVTLTLTIAERRIRISRSPAWERPKRRGSGMTTQQASVRLEQEIDGAWQCLATRLDEAGHLINTWLGMTPVQFTQVALLPQGGFQTFLHAPSAARQAVLQRLFRTDRFERVERWFAEFRRTLNRNRSEALHAVDVIAHRFAEVAGATEPSTLATGIDGLEDWAEGLHRAALADAAAAAAASDGARAAHLAASDELTGAMTLAATLDRAAEAQRQLAELEATAADFAVDLEALRAHDKARSLAPLLAASVEAKRAAEDAEQRAAAALTQAGSTTDSSEDLDLALERARHDLLRAEEVVALAIRLEDARANLAATEAIHLEASAAVARLRAATEAIPKRQAEVARQMAEAVQARLDLAACRAEIGSTQERVEACGAWDRAAADLSEKRELRRSTQDRVQELRQAYQDAREARIEAMASELALGLVAGCSCPVCGSTAHPSPAAAAGGTGRKAEERARRRYESAAVELTALEDVISGLSAQVEMLRQRSGGTTLAESAAQLSALNQRAADLEALADQVDPLQATSTQLERELVQAFADLEGFVRAESQAQASIDALTTQIGEGDQELAAALGDHANPDDFAAHARMTADALQRAVAAVRTRDEAWAAATQQRASLDLQARSLGFESGHDALNAVLDDDRAQGIADEERARAQAAAAAGAALADPEVLASGDTSRPDLAVIAARAQQAEQMMTAAGAREEITAHRADRLSVIRNELAAALVAFRPLDARAQEVSALSGLLEGTGADNRTRMRLSAFVLAERLRQVVAAANARLEVISEGRYVLRYQEERGAGENRGGLSLSVLDEWTGVRRDPSTLSGGETFVVSLCLALGLADTVADESGGLRIDTLFIDEGFGSLDARTLDSVIDILSQLSQGGRVTGVVSHVMELRERLPAVLEVVSSKSGSTVRRASA